MNKLRDALSVLGLVFIISASALTIAPHEAAGFDEVDWDWGDSGGSTGSSSSGGSTPFGSVELGPQVSGPASALEGLIEPQSQDPYVPYQKTTEYKLLTAGIVAALTVKAGTQAVKAGIATYVPGGSTAVAVEGGIETLLTAGALYGLGYKEAAKKTLIRKGFSLGVGAALSETGNPIGSYVALGLTLGDLTKEVVNLKGSFLEPPSGGGAPSGGEPPTEPPPRRPTFSEI